MDWRPKDRHRTLMFAAAAIEKIIALDLPADPQSFELWYMYATGSNKQLIDDIDNALRSELGLTESNLNRLYAKYILSARSVAHLNNVADRLTGEVSQVIGMIDAAKSSAQRYGNNLEDGALKFDGIDTTGEFKPILTALIGATNKMVRENCVLKEQLSVSRNKTEKLEQEIDFFRVESLTDALTSAGNRQYFEDSLCKAVASAHKYNSPLVLLLVDVDRFKTINDEFGHPIGDDVLRMVASRIKSNMRDDEIFARYGGDEFGIIVHGKPLFVAKLLAERIRKSIESSEIKLRSTTTVLSAITVSIGVAQLNRGETSADLIRHTDNALYAAKRAGRNVVVSQADVETTAQMAQG
jgi:diguanylate cyclase